MGLALVRDRLDNTVRSGAPLRRSPVLGWSAASRSTRNYDEGLQSRSKGTTRLSRSLFVSCAPICNFQCGRSAARNRRDECIPGEGKSTTAVNIALALAEAEHNVVLVDGDLRRPSVDKYLDLIGSVGFSTVLSGSVSLSEVLQTTTFTNLTVLTSGTTPRIPASSSGHKLPKHPQPTEGEIRLRNHRFAAVAGSHR